jgi:hypothetical protein
MLSARIIDAPARTVNGGPAAHRFPPLNLAPEGKSGQFYTTPIDYNLN